MFNVVIIGANDEWPLKTYVWKDYFDITRNVTRSSDLEQVNFLREVRFKGPFVRILIADIFNRIAFPANMNRHDSIEFVNKVSGFLKLYVNVLVALLFYLSRRYSQLPLKFRPDQFQV